VIFEELNKIYDIYHYDKKVYIIIDNINLILRHYENNPFKLINFILDIHKKKSIFIIQI
jgi:hypothetical protein